MTTSTNAYFPKSKKDALRAGYVPLTDPYIHGEYHLMERVIRDMRRGQIDYVLVNETDNKAAICVYRKTSSFGATE